MAAVISISKGTRALNGLYLFKIICDEDQRKTERAQIHSRLAFILGDPRGDVGTRKSLNGQKNIWHEEK